MRVIILKSVAGRILRPALGAIALALAAHGQVRVTLLATTDLHGHIYPVDYFTAQPAPWGLARIATLIRTVRQQNPNTLLIDCGDTIQGSPLQSLWQRYVATGRLPGGLSFQGPPPAADPMMLAMNALGYDAMVVGNHEFNFGLKNLERARFQARFPWLAANIAAQAARRPFDPYLLREMAGVRVAVVGLTTPAVPAWEKPENYRGYHFLDPTEAFQVALGRLRREWNPDLIILAVHAGLERDLKTGEALGGVVPGENVVYALARAPHGPHAIVFGHTHREIAGARVGGVLVVQPGHWGRSLARLDFEFAREALGGWRLTSSTSRLLPAVAVAPDSEILALARPYHELTERYLNTPVAKAPAELDGRLARIGDSALVDAIHAVQLHYARADVSFTALFNPRVRIPPGPVTVRQLAAIYTYDNELYAVQGTGSMVKAALENAARFFLSCPDAACSHGPLINPRVPGFNYDMAQGVEYEIDLRRPPGERVVNLRRRGKPLAPDEPLRIAVNSYRAAGSAGYQMFRQAPVLWRSTSDLRELMVEYYRRRGRLPEAPDGNWRIVPPQAQALLAQEVTDADRPR